MRLAALAASISLTLTGCGTTDARLRTAATEQGRMSAAINLPALPDDCRAREPHAALAEGMELRSVIVRERSATTRANDRVERCASFYDETKGRLEHGA